MEGEQRFIRLPEVQRRVGLGKTKIYEMVKNNEFPRPTKAGRATLWPSAAVNKWVEQRIAQ